MFEEFCGKENLNVFLRSNFDTSELSPSIPSYYIESIKYWRTLKLEQDDIFEPFLWYNKNIKIANKTVFSKRLFAMGMWRVSDLNHEGKLIEFNILLARGAKQSDFLIWRGLLKAIPDGLKQLDNNHPQFNTGYFLCGISKTNIMIEKATEKQIKSGIKYASLQAMQMKDFKARAKFEAIHGDIRLEEWAKILALPHSLNIDNFTKDLQYKILNRFLPTNKLLFKMNKTVTNVCPLCNLQVDTLEHAIWDCLLINSFWHEIIVVWNGICHTAFIPTLKCITFGVLENNCQSLNILILFGKKFIHKAKNCNVQLSTIQFIEFLKTKLYKIDPDTEKILQFIKALCPEFDIAAK